MMRNCECLGVSCGGVGQQWPAVGSGAQAATVLGGSEFWHKSSWRRLPYALTIQTAKCLLIKRSSSEGELLKELHQRNCLKESHLLKIFDLNTVMERELSGV